MPSIISQQRIQRFIQSRFNPIRSLTPEWLSSMIDSFDAGFLREFAMMSDAIERRDDILASVAPKRKKAIGRYGYEIVAMEKSAAATAHKKTLEHFFSHVTAVNAISENERGGFKLLVKQMADAIGKKYAVHEIVWKPGVNGLTAEFRFAPLWFFENRTGRLRYLPQEGMTEGLELEADNWLISVGDGLMLPCAIAYMFKNLPLKDWLIYCERFGMPIPIGETNAPKDSPEWGAMLSAVEAIMGGAAAVKNAGENITLLETKGTGVAPHKGLVERMDRAMSAMWRGSDLSTMSRGAEGGGRSSGASVQGEESEILEHDDTEWISETLNIQVSRKVIAYTHGDDEPLAYIKVLTARRQDTQNEILIDQFLRDSGFPISFQSASERYGRPIPESVDPEEVLKAAGSGGVPGEKGADLGNPADRQPTSANEAEATAADLLLLNSAPSTPEARSKTLADLLIVGNTRVIDTLEHLVSKAAARYDAARKQDLAGIAARLESIFAMPSQVAQGNALGALSKELPAFLAAANKSPAMASILAETMTAALFNGIDDSVSQRKTQP